MTREKDIAEMSHRLEELENAYSAFAEEHRIASMAMEDIVVAAVRAARMRVDGFAENFDSALITRIQQSQASEPPRSGYFPEIERLANLLGCSDAVRPKGPGA